MESVTSIKIICGLLLFYCIQFISTHNTHYSLTGWNRRKLFKNKTTTEPQSLPCCTCINLWQEKITCLQLAHSNTHTFSFQEISTYVSYYCSCTYFLFHFMDIFFFNNPPLLTFLNLISTFEYNFCPFLRTVLLWTVSAVTHAQQFCA